MATPSMQELIERLEKLEIASTAPSTIAQRKEFGDGLSGTLYLDLSWGCFNHCGIKLGSLTQHLEL